MFSLHSKQFLLSSLEGNFQIKFLEEKNLWNGSRKDKTATGISSGTSSRRGYLLPIRNTANREVFPGRNVILYPCCTHVLSLRTSYLSCPSQSSFSLSFWAPSLVCNSEIIISMPESLNHDMPVKKKTRFCPRSLSSSEINEDRALKAILYKRKSLEVKSLVMLSFFSVSAAHQ